MDVRNVFIQGELNGDIYTTPLQVSKDPYIV